MAAPQDIGKRILKKSFLILAFPVDHHPCLRKGKRNEDPDGIKRNQAFCLPIKDQEQNDGTNRQGQNPIRIAQTIPLFPYTCVACIYF